MSNLIDYAKAELERAFPNETDEMQLAAIQDIMELIEKFSEQNHSGFSGSYVLRYFERLVNFNPIRPLTGEEDEWDKPWGENQTQQNKRCSKIFRDNFDNSTAVNIEGKVFIDENGLSYTCYDSRVPVKFPYNVPDKPEYVHKKRGD